MNLQIAEWGNSLANVRIVETCIRHDKCVSYTQMTSADLIRDMQKAGWRLERVNGSHHVFKHPNRLGHVVVSHPKKDLGLGLVKAIRTQAGI